MPLNSFLTCALHPSASYESVIRSGDGWKLSGFFQDSSLRSTFSLPIQIECTSPTALNEILATNCLDIFLVDEANKQGSDDISNSASASTKQTSSPFSLAVEAKVLLTFGTGEALSALVENVVLKHARVQGLCIDLETEITLRVRSDAGRIDPSSVVKINLEVGAVLTEELPPQTQAEAAVEGLKALNLGGLPEIGLESQHQKIRFARLAPFELNIALTFAMKITARSVPSHVMGQTLVSLTISHSSMHSECLTITNIALHPGHSIMLSSDNRQQVTDMSRCVNWAYADKCAPSLPLVLDQHGSYSTCLVVYATGDKLTRSFSSPISVTALVGASERTNLFRSVVAACDVQWTTCRAAVEPADAFRVDLRLVNTEVVSVGSLVIVEVELTNLSAEPRQLMLLVDNSRETGQTAAISSKGGHKFGVWGLLNNGFAMSNDGERELLAVDLALLVGDVNAGAVTRAEVRFVALAEGALRIPNFRLVDRRKGKWYAAVHNLQVVAQAADARV